MKIFAIISLLALMIVGPTGTTLAQAPKKCEFNVIGTWKAQVSSTEARLYTFESDGTVKVTSVDGTAKPREISTAKYDVLDNLDTSGKQISFTATGKNRIFGKLNSTINVESFDDTSMTCAIPGAGSVRWTKVDPNRYFIIFVAREGEFHDKSGSAFPMVIKIAEGVSKVDAAGIYSDQGKAAFGAVPSAIYKDYMREARGDREVILRLEINPAQYERASKIVQDWGRRAREGTLLYTIDNAITNPNPLNNVLLVKTVMETLNLCQSDFDLYNLDYAYPTDWIANQYSPEFLPFELFKELRKRNEARHIEYSKFQALVPMPHVASR
jgi:hypothetical protein